MFRKGLLVGFCLLLIPLSINANEIAIKLSQGKPTQQEFVLAAKRALYSRNYEIWSVDPDVVIGKYRGKVEMALILTDDAVILRNTDHGGVKLETISKYLNNLRRDFIYELANYTLAPVAKSDPAKARALVESANKPVDTSSVTRQNYQLAGTYEANISGSHNSPDFRNAKFEVRIFQEGRKITGIFGKSGKIWGYIKNETIEFEWFATGGWSGKGSWEIDSGNNDLKGTWSHGKWNMTKMK